MTTITMTPFALEFGLSVAVFRREPAQTALLAAADRAIYELEIMGQGDRRVVPVTEWRTCHEPFEGQQGAEGATFVAKVELPELPAGTRIEFALLNGDQTVAEASAWTKPATSMDRFTLAFGSCFGIRSNPLKPESAQDDLAFDEAVATHLVKAHRRLGDEGGGPIYNIWLGDQTYLDDPPVGALGDVNIHDRILSKYDKTWGLDGPSGLGRLLSRSTNWYLPDDHEFWNGFPRANITLLGHTGSRLVEQARRWLRHRGEQTHPYHQGSWGRVAGAAFMAFQSVNDSDLNQFDDTVSPPELQTITTDDVSVVLFDTRWRRTMLRSSHGKRHAGFASEKALQQLFSKLDDERLVIVCLARPLFGRPPQKFTIPIISETAPEHYREQYRRLLAAVETRAAQGKPTVLLGGDVHHHSARLGLDERVLEFVCSPMSLIATLDNRDNPNGGQFPSPRWFARKGRDLLNWAEGKLNRPTKEQSWAIDPGLDLFPYPTGSDEHKDDGLATLAVDTTSSTAPRVTYSVWLRNQEQPASVTLRWAGQRWHVVGQD